MTITVPAFSNRARSDLEQQDSEFDWALFKDDLQEFSRIVDELEIGTGAGPPKIENDEQFAPGGWAGELTDSVRVLPAAKDSEKGEQIDEEVYNEFVEGARRVVGTYGVRTASAYLSLMPQAVREAETTYLAYSRRLLHITKRLFENRLPVTIEQTTSTGYELRGAPDFPRSIKEQAKGTGRVVSREISFSTITPVTRLLALFHARLAEELSVLSNDLGLDDERLNKQLRHHKRIRQTQLPEEIVRAPKTENVPSPDNLEQMRSSHRAPVRELATLWQGFKRDLGTRLDWRQRFDSAIKPVQRVYELWCLERILSTLTSEFGEYEIQKSEKDRLPVPKKYDFGEIILFYDRSVRNINGKEVSRHVGPQFRKAGGTVGKPDFLISKNGTPVWMADAKFQDSNNLDTSGLYRFLGYLVDYLPPDEGHAVLLCATGDSSDIQTKIEDRTTSVISTMADSAQAEERISKSIRNALDLV